MRSSKSKQWLNSNRVLHVLLLIIIVIGICFRLANLSGKVYWHDEAYTALYTTGQNGGQVFEQVMTGEMTAADELRQFQTIVPGNGIVATLETLATYDVQHPPAYYLLARLCMGVITDPVVATRLAASIAGILVIPSMVWLAWELFYRQSYGSAAGIIAAAIVAVSPFHYIYAQEAREYSLWTLFTVLASAALLRALRRNHWVDWGLYCLSLTAGLYSCILMAIVLMAHSLYVAMVTRLKLAKNLRFILATVSSLALFWPWLRLINNINAASWTAEPMPLPTLARVWVGNLTRLFLDLNLDASSSLMVVLPVVVCSIGLTLYTLFWCGRRLPRPAAIFLAILAGVTLCTFLGPDILLGGRRSSVSRYLIPAYLSLQMAISGLFAYQLSVPRSRSALVWSGLLSIILAAGLISCSASVPADTWWHKKNSHLNPEVARIVNQTPDALLVSSSYNVNLGELLSLSHLLEPKQPLLLFREPEVPNIPDTFGSVYLFNLSREARERISKMTGSAVETACFSCRLWRIVPENSAD